MYAIRSYYGMYVEYMQSVIDNPYFVGAHWFQYLDSPITGRAFDGENYNVGFVSVADVPYETMVEAAKTLHRKMYLRKYVITSYSIHYTKLYEPTSLA